MECVTVGLSIYQLREIWTVPVFGTCKQNQKQTNKKAAIKLERMFLYEHVSFYFVWVKRRSGSHSLAREGWNVSSSSPALGTVSLYVKNHYEPGEKYLLVIYISLMTDKMDHLLCACLNTFFSKMSDLSSTFSLGSFSFAHSLTEFAKFYTYSG